MNSATEQHGVTEQQMITVYGISNCDTVRKARKWLTEQDIHHQFHDFRKQGIDATLVQTLLQHFDPDTLINRRGTTWRQLDDAARNISDEADLIALLASQPALIKRPVIDTGQHWLIGFDQHTRDTLLKTGTAT